MEGPEFGGSGRPVADAELFGELYGSFCSAVVQDICASLAQEPDIVQESHCLSELTRIAPDKVLPYLEQARLSIAITGITEGNRSNARRVAEAYAEIGRFDEALAIADEIDAYSPPQPGCVDYKTSLFRWQARKVPEEYIERAVLTLTHLGNSEAVLTELYMFGERNRAARNLVLGVAGQIVTDYLLPETESLQEADSMLAEQVYVAAKWGDLTAAQALYGPIQTPSRRLHAELTVCETANVLLEHQDLDQVYDAVMNDMSDFTNEQKAELLLRLHKLGRAVDGAVVWDLLQDMDEGAGKVWLMSDFVKTYRDRNAYERLIEGITEQSIKDAPYRLLRIAEALPGLLVDCEATILSWLLGGGEEGRWEQEAVVRDLLEDYIAIDRPNEALELLQSFKDREFFDDIQGPTQEALIVHTAQKGREHFEDALSLVAAFSQGADSYSSGVLLASLVKGAHDYLTPDERETYLQACDGNFMTYSGWLMLARATKRAEYLVRARQYVEPNNTQPGRAAYRRHLLGILEAYKEIAATAEGAQ